MWRTPRNPHRTYSDAKLPGGISQQRRVQVDNHSRRRKKNPYHHSRNVSRRFGRREVVGRVGHAQILFSALQVDARVHEDDDEANRLHRQIQEALGQILLRRQSNGARLQHTIRHLRCVVSRINRRHRSRQSFVQFSSSQKYIAGSKVARRSAGCDCAAVQLLQIRQRFKNDVPVLLYQTAQEQSATILHAE